MKTDHHFLTKIITVFLMSLLNFSLFGQFSSDSLWHIEVQGNDTDPLINFDGVKKHQVFYNSTSQTQSTLLLHLVGSFDNPNSTILFPTVAANSGFHCINLTYRNGVSGEGACADVPDSDCHLNYRKEIIEGIDYSPEVNVNAANSINNRLLKLLQYLDMNFPSQNWGQYYSGTAISWDKLIISGHSQGGGHAAVIGITEPIQRVLMFASPNDYSDTLNSLASWTQLPHLVPDSNYYAFNALYDDVIDYWIQHAHSDALNLDDHGDTVNVDEVNFPFNSTRQLYTKQIETSPNPLELTHDIMIRDAETPVDSLGNPVFTCVWKYMLGIDCAVTSINENSVNDLFQIYPNPAIDKVFIETQGSIDQFNVVIVDVFGRKKLSAEFSGNDKNGFDIHDFSKGIYFIQLFNGTSLIGSKRFVKM